MQLMPSGVRKLALTAHVTSSVGWFGAVVAFLSLALAGVTSDSAQLVRGAYVAMDLTTWMVIVPFAIAALLTGILQSLGTAWGLFRHYWVVTKLALTVAATVILIVHTQPIGQLAAFAATGPLSVTDLHGLRIQLIADAGAALAALLVATTLSVYKPWGMTAYGRRAAGLDAVIIDQQPPAAWAGLWLIGLLIVLILFALVHLMSGRMHHH